MQTEIVNGLLTLAHALVIAYMVRIISRDVFQYLNHRLDVLGKDAFVLYPRDRYTMTEDGRYVRTDGQHGGILPCDSEPDTPSDDAPAEGFTSGFTSLQLSSRPRKRTGHDAAAV